MKEKKHQEELKKVPTPVVGTLILNKEGKILLAKAKKWSGKYAIFGGHLDWSEPVDAGALRETKEETGLDVMVVARLNFGEHIGTGGAGHYDSKHMIYLDFLCRFDGDDDAVKLNDEYEEGEYIWVDANDALKLDLASGTRDIIGKYLKYKETESYLDDLKRIQADFENYKKRQQGAQKELGGYLIEKLVLDIVPVLDNFRSATMHVPPEQKDSPWVVGIQYIEKQLETVLTDNGVQTIEVKEGEEFDPKIHEALEMQNENIKKENTGEEIEEKKNTPEGHVIAKVIQKGYKFGDRVIRPAKVIVK